MLNGEQNAKECDPAYCGTGSNESPIVMKLAHKNYAIHAANQKYARKSFLFLP